jgi:hypothetical protein
VLRPAAPSAKRVLAGFSTFGLPGFDRAARDHHFTGADVAVVIEDRHLFFLLIMPDPRGVMPMLA